MPPDVVSVVGASLVIWNWSVPGYCGVLPSPGALLGAGVRTGDDVGAVVASLVGAGVAEPVGCGGAGGDDCDGRGPELPGVEFGAELGAAVGEVDG